MSKERLSRCIREKSCSRIPRPMGSASIAGQDIGVHPRRINEMCMGSRGDQRGHSLPVVPFSECPNVLAEPCRRDTIWKSRRTAWENAWRRGRF